MAPLATSIVGRSRCEKKSNPSMRARPRWKGGSRKGKGARLLGYKANPHLRVVNPAESIVACAFRFLRSDSPALWLMIYALGGFGFHADSHGAGQRRWSIFSPIQPPPCGDYPSRGYKPRYTIEDSHEAVWKRVRKLEGFTLGVKSSLPSLEPQSRASPLEPLPSSQASAGPSSHRPAPSGV